MIPTRGRIVYYTVPSYVAQEINRRRDHYNKSRAYHEWKSNGTQVHTGNFVEIDQVVPAVIVAVWGDSPDCSVNLKLLLDGNDDYWVTSTNVEEPKTDKDGKPVHTAGKFHWMDYQKGQAAKSDALLAEFLQRIQQLEDEVQILRRPRLGPQPDDPQDQ